MFILPVQVQVVVVHAELLVLLIHPEIRLR